MPALERPYVTEAEFLARPATDVREELFDGEIVVSAAPMPRHQMVLAELYDALKRWARAQRPAWQVLFAPVDVRFGVDRILEPDLVVFDEPLAWDHPRLVTRIPRVTVEVLSPSSVDYDRFGKRLAYAEAGVGAYLVVDPDAAHVEVFDGEGLRRRTVCRAVLVVPGLDGLAVDLGEVFGRPER